MSYETVTITTLEDIPVRGFASDISVQAGGGHAFHPTFNKILAVEKDTEYVITIANLEIVFDTTDNLDFEPDLTEIDININGTVYKNCRKLGGAAAGTPIAPGRIVFTGTSIYRGYIWD